MALLGLRIVVVAYVSTVDSSLVRQWTGVRSQLRFGGAADDSGVGAADDSGVGAANVLRMGPVSAVRSAV